MSAYIQTNIKRGNGMNKEDYKQMIIEAMKYNGDYNESYDLVIVQLAEVQEIAEGVHKQILENPDVFIKHTDKNGNIKMMVNPAYSVWFDLQRTIGSYLRELGLR